MQCKTPELSLALYLRLSPHVSHGSSFSSDQISGTVGDPPGSRLGEVGPARLDRGRRGVEPRLLVVPWPDEFGREATLASQILVESRVVGGVLNQNVGQRVDPDQLFGKPHPAAVEEIVVSLGVVSNHDNQSFA